MNINRMSFQITFLSVPFQTQRTLEIFFIPTFIFEMPCKVSFSAYTFVVTATIIWTIQWIWVGNYLKIKNYKYTYTYNCAIINIKLGLPHLPRLGIVYF